MYRVNQSRVWVWEIGYTQACINCWGKSNTHFVYFLSRKTLPYTHLEATSYIPQQGQSLHIWTTSLSTTGCYKNKHTIQFLWMACISRFATTILTSGTELVLGTIRVKTLKWHEKYIISEALLILQPFAHFTYVTAHSPTLPALYLRQSSFSNPSVASPTLQFIPQPFFRFSYVTSSSFNSPGEPPMLLLLVTLEVPRVLRVLRRHTRRPEGENTPRTENSGTTPLFVKQELATFSGSQKYILF